MSFPTRFLSSFVFFIGITTLWHCQLALSLQVFTRTSSTRQPSSLMMKKKQKVAVLGAGGYTGGLVFGFLQRAGSLYHTGIDSHVRCIGATRDTSIQLNRILSKHFILAMADESYIQLTNFNDPSSIANQLKGYDALILGSGMITQTRTVTPNTYEQSPNDKTTELYWQGTSTEQQTSDDNDKALTIIKQVLQASQHLQHVVVLDPTGSLLPILQQQSVPFTCIQTSSPILTTRDYTYRKGEQGPLSVSTTASTIATTIPIYMEDLAALSVQCLMSLDWTTSSSSRSLYVTADPTTSATTNNNKRPDQEWCVNSYQLEEALKSISSGNRPQPVE